MMNIPVTRNLLAVQAAWAVVFAVTGRLWSDSPNVASPQPQTLARDELGDADDHRMPPSTSFHSEQADTYSASESPINASTIESDDQSLEPGDVECEFQIQVDLARAELRQYLEAEFPSRQRQLETQCRLAKHDQRQARDQYEYLRRLSKKGYCRQAEVEQARMQLSKVASALETAKEARSTFSKHRHPRRLLELEGAVRKKVRNLLLAKEKANLAVSKAHARWGRDWEMGRISDTRLTTSNAPSTADVRGDGVSK